MRIIHVNSSQTTSPLSSPLQSPCQDVSIPQKDIPTLLFYRKDRPYPANHPIYIDYETKETFTYERIRESSLRFGASLQDRWQWQKGDVMAIMAPNTIEFGPIVWGVHCALGIVTPANPGYTANEIAHQLRDSGARAIVTTVDALNRVKDAAKAVGIPFDKILLLGSTEVQGHHTWTSFLGHRLANPTEGLINPSKDLAFICYSSGTTGLPKGVMISHRNTVSNIHQAQTLDFSQLKWNHDKLIGVLPFYHIYGLMTNIHLPMFNGVSVVVHHGFKISAFLDSIQHHRITLIHVVPPVILMLAKDPLVDRYDLSSLRMIVSGAAPLTHELQLAVYNRIKVPVKQAYGLTETSPLVLSAPWDKMPVPGSSGYLMPNLLLKFVSESGQELQRGETGELWLKGPNVMQGYLNNSAATAEAFEDGWFKTGDVGHIDEDNNVFITDRAKELIKYKGFQVAPAELEGLLLSREEVDDVCVIGIQSDTQATELPRALCVLKKGIAPSVELEKDIVQFVESKVIHYKRLRGGVRFIDSIPKSASGKILRRILRNGEHGKEAVQSKL